MFRIKKFVENKIMFFSLIPAALIPPTQGIISRVTRTFHNKNKNINYKINNYSNHKTPITKAQIYPAVKYVVL